MRKKKAFTLIELLIVVAIIAILALIAVPNFLDAQVRSKVARVKSDMRSFATGIEAYAVDHNRVPRMMHNTMYGDEYNGVAVYGILWWGLSTPIAYITSVYIVDPFQAHDMAAPLDEQFYTYQDMQAYLDYFGTAFWVEAIEFYGTWRMCSVGPDKQFGHPITPPTAQLCYDPTNGTISYGNIWRSQKNPESVQPPVGTMLGPH